MTYGRDRTLIDVVIDVSADNQVSLDATVGALTIVGVIMPTAWTAAGDLLIQALVDEPYAEPKVPVYADLLDEAGQSIPLVTGVAASKYYSLQITPLIALGRIRLKATVAQGADRRIQLVCV
jgi:hypothetical protein